MYPRASGGLGRPQTPGCFQGVITYTTCINKYAYLCIIALGISPKIQSCSFIIPLRKNMITHSLTMKVLYFLLLVKNKIRSKFRS